MSYMDKLEKIALDDLNQLGVKDREYGGSWKKRGGIGAFFSLSRKWDRLELSLQRHYGWDIFKAVEEDRREEGIIDDIRDLRRYLLLVEGYCLAEDRIKKTTFNNKNTTVDPFKLYRCKEGNEMYPMMCSPNRDCFKPGKDKYCFSHMESE